MQIISQKSIFLKSGQISIGNSVAYIKTKWKTLAIAANTESGIPFSEINSATGSNGDFTWSAKDGWHFHEIIDDIIETTYTYLMYRYTIDTAGVFSGYNRTVQVYVNNHRINSQNYIMLGEYYFPAGQAMTFTFLIYRAHGNFNIRYSGFSDYPAYYGTVCTPNVLLRYDDIDKCSMAVYDRSIDDLTDANESEKFKTGLAYYMTSAEGYGINYNQAFQTSYYLYGIM